MIAEGIGNILSKFFCAALVLLTATAPVRGQDADATLRNLEALASFEDARSVSIDPSGNIYVVDGGRSVVYRLNRDGKLIDQVGGSGSGDYEFDDPHDVDPTNGLVILVADAGNQRIQRYSREFRYLETLHMAMEPGISARAVSRAGYRTQEREPLSLSEGRPIAVATAVTGETYAIDGLRNVIVKWDRNRKVERVFGGFDAGEGALSDPVSLAVDRDGNVYVADRGLRSVVVFDLFGNYLRTLISGRAEGIRSVIYHRERLIVVLPYRLLVYDETGRLSRTLDVAVEDPLVDVAVLDSTFYVVTRGRLFRAGL